MSSSSPVRHESMGTNGFITAAMSSRVLLPVHSSNSNVDNGLRWWTRRVWLSVMI